MSRLPTWDKGPPLATCPFRTLVAVRGFPQLDQRRQLSLVDISSVLRQLVGSDASEVASAFMQSISNMQTTSCDPSQLLQASRRDVHQYEAWQLDPGPNRSLPPSGALKTLSFEASIQLSDGNVVATPADDSS